MALKNDNEETDALAALRNQVENMERALTNQAAAMNGQVEAIATLIVQSEIPRNKAEVEMMTHFQDALREIIREATDNLKVDDNEGIIGDTGTAAEPTTITIQNDEGSDMPAYSVAEIVSIDADGTYHVRQVTGTGGDPAFVVFNGENAIVDGAQGQGYTAWAMSPIQCEIVGNGPSVNARTRTLAGSWALETFGPVGAYQFTIKGFTGTIAQVIVFQTVR